MSSPAAAPHPPGGCPVAASAKAHRGGPTPPYRLQTSGIGWLVAAVVLVGRTPGDLRPRPARPRDHGHGDRRRGGLAGRPSWAGGDAVPAWGVARIGSWGVLYALYYGLVLALLVLRRWRYLIVWLVVRIVASNVTLGLLAIARRPRPFGVDFRPAGAARLGAAGAAGHRSDGAADGGAVHAGAGGALA